MTERERGRKGKGRKGKEERKKGKKEGIWEGREERGKECDIDGIDEIDNYF